MFIEENYEAYVKTLFKNAGTPGHALYDVALRGVKHQPGDVTLDNIGEYIKVAPCVVYNVGEDNRVLSTGTALNDVQMISFMLHVYVFTVNKFSQESGKNTARPLLRAVKNLLRGLRYGPAEGSTEGMTRLLYIDQEKQGASGPHSLYLQRYEIHSKDTNDTRRTA